MTRANSLRGRVRADQRLVELGLVASRSQAQALILAGDVYLQSTRVDKPGELLPMGAKLLVRAGPRFVSRGGEKLEGALHELNLNVAGLLCVDVGASTGGFTDCLLQHGARRVYTVDVGRGQLAAKLRSDPRVVVWEGTNARHLPATAFAESIDLVVVDASFISLAKLLPAISSWLSEGARLMPLIKPQFEVGRVEARRSRGVIRDSQLRKHAILTITEQITAHGFVLLGGSDSKLAGPRGNIEHFVLAMRR